MYVRIYICHTLIEYGMGVVSVDSCPEKHSKDPTTSVWLMIRTYVGSLENLRRGPQLLAELYGG